MYGASLYDFHFRLSNIRLFNSGSIRSENREQIQCNLPYSFQTSTWWVNSLNPLLDSMILAQRIVFRLPIFEGDNFLTHCKVKWLKISTLLKHATINYWVVPLVRIEQPLLFVYLIKYLKNYCNRVLGTLRRISILYFIVAILL